MSLIIDHTIKIGGEAGQGIQTIGESLARILTRAGYHVFCHQDYESRIRGGHNFYQIRFSNKPVTASRRSLDILVALDKESVLLYKKEIKPEGFILYDSRVTGVKYNKSSFLNIPFQELALAHGGSQIMANTVAIGAVIGMLDLDRNILFSLIKETFKKKDYKILEDNLRAAEAGYRYAKEVCQGCYFNIPLWGPSKMLINGNEAIGAGAIASGLKFYAAYPMTPSTGIFNFIAERAEKFGIIVEQAEDEISAINMVIGASFGGVRAMTGTSGGGFALMVEGLSLAAMTETPVVIVLAQRPGPATGLPTRTEQAELLFALFAGHGEFPRVILAPGSPEEAFYLTNKAFDLAEKFQIPAIILTDQYLADSQWSYEKFDPSKLKIYEYRVYGEDRDTIREYKRHVFTPTGVSPLRVPGEGNYLVITDSDEHDEEGHITEDAEIRVKMVEKRLFKKMSYLKREISPPKHIGSKDPEVVIFCWGSTFGVVREVVENLSSKMNIAMLHFGELWPFSEETSWLELAKRARILISIEQNATNQLARLIMMETGLKIEHHINRFDGRPFTVEELEERLHAYLRRL